MANRQIRNASLQVFQYLVNKLETEIPPEELERTSLVYKLFGLIPDTLDLGKLFLDLYTEQIVGFFDPATDSLYVVAGADALEVRLIVAHELVHALQAQYGLRFEYVGICALAGGNP